MKVTLLTADDLIWPRGMQDSIPEYKCGTGEYPRTFKVDPYPAYTHNLQLVDSLVAQCEKAFPITEARVGLWLFSHDFVDRVNGMTFEDSLYTREDGTEWDEKISCACHFLAMKLA